jgi:excisionase family DNA binding protein
MSGSVRAAFGQLLTVAEAAEVLGRTEGQLRWLIHSGKGPKSALVGGRRVFRLADLEAYVEEAFDEAAG